MAHYIKVFTSYWNHRKTLRLKVALGDAAVCLPLRLWSYAAGHQTDGDFSAFSCGEMALLIGWTGDGKEMIAALQSSGFLDADMKIHDWNDYNSYHSTFAERSKKAAEARWKDKKAPPPLASPSPIRRDKRQALLEQTSSNASSMLQASAPELLSVEGFAEAWKAFEAHRVTKKARLTPVSAAIILGKLAKHPSRSVEALHACIERNWQSFEWSWLDKNNLKANGRPTPTGEPGTKGNPFL